MDFSSPHTPSDQRGFVDLHLHSVYSDGLLTPKQIIEEAQRRGLKAVSITDHDAVAGVEEALTFGSLLGVEVIPGIEISVLHQGVEIHLLGYYIDSSSAAIAGYIELLAESRRERAQKIVQALEKEGINIAYEMVLQKANGAPIGRPHIAQVMVEEGYVFSVYEAFQKYLGENRSGDIPKFSLSLRHAVEIIKDAGGLVFWAHPATTPVPEELLPLLLACGLDGIEVIHPKHPPEKQAQFADWAKRFRLLQSGGSDCHGGREGNLMLGTMKVPESLFTQIKERAVSTGRMQPPPRQPAG
ncbi:MAG: PHP domain-containing protein [candidate division KSB1 bacterium]|nr:PHP domain-containing protein [candidate division KSB1 bacterium]